jgi:5-methylcytosine-specific restriction endonuclease McrA
MSPRKIFTAAERFRVFERDGFCCVYCGKSAVDGVCLSVAFHLDHVYPRSRGGSDLMSNLATACSDCNAGKGDSVLSQLPPGIDDSVEAGFARHCQRNDVVNEDACK